MTFYRFNLRYVLCLGMVLSAFTVFVFGSLGPWLNIHSRYYYGILWGLNGNEIDLFIDHVMDYRYTDTHNAVLACDTL